MSDLEEQKPGVSRRTVAKAMAWSVPAVALAVPAPAYAASPRCIPTIELVGCRCPGQSTDFPFTYFVSFCVTLPPDCGEASITINDVRSNTGGEPSLVPVGFAFPITVSTGDCDAQVFELMSTNSSINLLVDVAGFPEAVETQAPVQQCEECEGDATLQATTEQAPATEEAAVPEETAAPEETVAPETPAP